MKYGIVVIAASAGGITAIAELLSGLPAEFPIPILIVQHRATTSSFLDRIFRTRTPLTVVEANLLKRTDIATVFLDSNLNIKRFTDQATKLITLRPTDVGRPITELASNLKHENFANTCRSVLKTLVSMEHEVVTTEGGWYLMRIMPYRTTENAVQVR